MKIAFIVPALVNKGPIIVVKSIVDHIFDKCSKIDVYYFDEGVSLDFKCNTIRLSFNRPIDFDAYDIIHAHCFRSDLYVFRWKHKIHCAKTISTLHQDTFQTLSFRFYHFYDHFIGVLFSYFWIYIQSKFDIVTTISEQLKSSYTLYFNNLLVIYNGCNINVKAEIDYDIKRQLLLLKKDYILLSTYAYITRRKGIIQLLSAVLANEKLALAIIGEGPALDELKEYVKTHSLQHRVVFFDYQKNPYLYMKYVDIYAITSYSEGFGLAIVEAAMMKVPIVCSDIPSFHEIFSEDEACFFELDNIDSLNKAILYAHDNADCLIINAYNKVVKNFTDTIMSQGYVNLYSSLIHEK